MSLYRNNTADQFLGYFTDLPELQGQRPVGVDGEYAIIISLEKKYYWDISTRSWEEGGDIESTMERQDDIISAINNQTTVNGVVSTDNSSTETLGAGEQFIGEWEDTLNYGTIIVNSISDVDSDSLQIDWSPDGINNYTVYPTIYPLAGSLSEISFRPLARYFRVRYVNNTSSAQTSFKLTTILKSIYVKPNTRTASGKMYEEDDLILGRNIITQVDDNGSFVNVGISAEGFLRTEPRDKNGAQFDLSELSTRGKQDEIIEAINVEWIKALGADTADATYYYVGYLKAGTFDWRIKRITKADYSIAWASGTAEDETALALVWTDRASQTYSLTL